MGARLSGLGERLLRNIIPASRRPGISYQGFRMLVEQTVTGALGVTASGVVTCFSESAASLLQINRGMSIGLNVILPAFTLPSAIGLSGNSAAVGRRPDGTIFQALVSASSMYLSNRKLFYIILIKDQSPTIAVEQRLSESTHLLHLMMDAASDPVAVRDRDSRYVMVNPALCRRLQMTEFQIIGRKPSDILPAAAAAVVEDADRRCIAGDSVVETQRLHFSKDEGEPATGYVLNTVRYPMHAEDGTVTGLLTISRDVTEATNAAAELKRAKEEAETAREAAERATANKTTFIAAASHDLRQPIQAMYMRLENLKLETLTPNGKKALEVLTLSVDTFKQQLDGLLDLSILEVGVTVPKLSSFPLKKLLVEIAAAFRPLAEAKGLTLCTVGGAWTATSDPTLLGRMIRNLVENAIRYTERGTIGIVCTPSENGVTVEVRDSGVGIDPEHCNWIWDEFRQVGNQERDRERGTGLGLSIVRRLSDILGHPVNVVSQPGEGSTFYVDVPAVPGIEAPAPVRGTKSHAGAGLRAMIIEDDPLVLSSLTAFMKASGYGVISASSGSEAMEMMDGRAFVPDIILADYRLKGARTGVEVISDIRSATGEMIPAAILTGEAGDEPRARAAEIGVETLKKPISPGMLTGTMERLIASVRSGPP